MDVVVLGSLNMDLVAQVDQLPLPGETILGKGFVTAPGGKGANQAVAAARLGAKTAMIGRVGADDFGMVLRNRLMAENIDVRGVLQSEQSPSGTALISVSPRDNQIIVVAGANGEVDEEELAELMPLL
ncbi:MAG: PfkB family carbohydrate kinase, partial [Cyanobacteria bacterium J06635_11]